MEKEDLAVGVAVIEGIVGRRTTATVAYSVPKRDIFFAISIVI